MNRIPLSLATTFVALLAAVPAAHAGTVWTTWNYPSGTSSASGTLGSNTVTYSGNLMYVTFVDGSYGWSPSGSYIGGNVTTTPTNTQLAVLLDGGLTANGAPTGGTISFGTPVTNPIIDIFSLGQTGDTASFVFSSPFTIVAGGPSTHYGGGSITSVGNTVYGTEGNGTIEFTGTYSSISFTTPTFEDYYAFTVGENPAATPEPGTLSLLGLGLGALPILRRRFLKR